MFEIPTRTLDGGGDQALFKEQPLVISPDIDLIWDYRDSLYSIMALLVMLSFIRQEFAPAQRYTFRISIKLYPHREIRIPLPFIYTFPLSHREFSNKICCKLSGRQ